MEENLKKLLEQIGEIIKRHEDQARITGGNFNVFNILRLTTNEVRTHSAFIAELLDPKGCHGQGDLFLKLFCKEFASDLELNTAKARVMIEKHIGRIEGDYDEGGNIDIIIESGGKAIIIENKINAKDQPKQLMRYHNYGSRTYKQDFKLFYLTLYGSPPTVDSKDILEENNHFFLLSYNKDILSWLQDCQTAVEKVPVIKETIVQYSNLIKQLTNQTYNIMKTDLSKMFGATGNRNIDNIKAIFAAPQIYEELRLEILSNDFIDMMDEIAKKNSLKFENISGGNFYQNYIYFSFYNPDWKNIRIQFQFQKSNLTDLNYGFVVLPLDNPVKNDKLKSFFKDNGSPYWYYDRPMVRFRNWDYETFISILNGEFQKEIDEKVKELLEMVNDEQLKPYL